MAKYSEDPLSIYVKRKMVEQNLSRHDVSVRSGGEIADSYVSAIVTGACCNLSVDKLKALARGLGVTEMELAGVALTGSMEPDPRDQTPPSRSSIILVDLKNKSVLASDVEQIARMAMHLNSKERAVVIQFMNKLAKSKKQQRPKKRA
ncbi:MAG TPA: helix-turn-helix transcriptional regulator [Blastocatellia bacterium]|nr:helix-turn-helix transcriptional regulator [Blastocatellia bacterium]